MIYFRFAFLGSGPRLDVSDESREILIFHQLVKFGVFQLPGKGIRNIQCFGEKQGETLLREYLKATVTGSPITIAKKTETSIVGKRPAELSITHK